MKGWWRKFLDDSPGRKRESGPRVQPDLSGLMGPLSGHHRHDLAVLLHMAGPLSDTAQTELRGVIDTLTTSTPPVLFRRGLTSDEVLSAVMAAVVMDHGPEAARLTRAAAIIRALDPSPLLASELLGYAVHPQMPRTLLHHLVHTVVGARPVTGVVEAVLHGLASGTVRANVKGAQVYTLDPMLWFLAHPKTLALALEEPGEPVVAAAYDHLRKSGLASGVMPVTVSTPQSQAQFNGFWSRADVWRDYAAAIGVDLDLSDTNIEGEPHLDLTACLLG